jgi:tubulin--tyrosine ligase-like protein 12
VEYEEGDPEFVVQTTAAVGLEDPEQVYLVDHAWTFTAGGARGQLEAATQLADRMAALMGVEGEEDTVEAVLRERWRHAQTYSLGDRAKEPLWYVMDEFGSRVSHSCSPSVRLVPFLWAGDGLAYSVLFPVTALGPGAAVTRDYIEGLARGRGPAARAALLSAWRPSGPATVSEQQLEPREEFFLAARAMETLPDPGAELRPLPTDRKIRVYSEYQVINQNLSHPRFTLTDSMADADILWLTSHFKDYEGLSREMPEKRINQFPCENVITIKDFLCVVCRRQGAGGEGPPWLPVTYNLETELEQFVSCYRARAAKGEDNHWIVKPWNLSRGLDMQVASSLTHILRLPAAGPKIAQKYLHSPVLFNRPGIGEVKFDVRYIILLRSVEPLEVFAYNRFWLRFANLPFSLEQLDVYEKHFTVMNYNDAELQQMFCDVFIQLFEEQNPGHLWAEVQADIFSMLRGVFDGATKLPAPCGLAPCPQAGAMYATDLMLDWREGEGGDRKIQPKVLEFNWLPDCERACDYYPEFFNNVFSTLFLGETEGQHVTRL